MALKGDSYTTTGDTISAGSLEPAGTVLRTNKKEFKWRRKIIGYNPRGGLHL
jgi:hypothetical protein